MLRSFIIVFLVLMGFQAQAQSPFNYGKNEDVYFLSAQDLRHYQINTVSHFYSGYLTQIDFTSNHYAVSVKYLTELDSLPSNQLKEEGIKEIERGHLPIQKIWEFQDHRAQFIGGDGYNSSCRSCYMLDGLHSRRLSYCEYEISSYTERITYNSMGLPLYSVCCDFLTSVRNIGLDHGGPSDKGLDTTYYVYDKDWKYKGTTNTNCDTVNIMDALFANNAFTFSFDVPDSNKTLYLNNGVFKDEIENRLGCTPRFILMEIYKNATFVFQYSESDKRYYSLGSISLEGESDLSY